MNKYYIFFLFFCVSCFPAPELAGQFTQAEFDEMATTMAKGKVEDIKTDQLKTDFDKYVVLDAREKKEYEISHIPGAIWIGYKGFELSHLEGIDKDAKVVTYCSVGYRSEKIGEKLLDAGYSDVSNLWGSIFAWINEGNVVVNDDGKPTLKVHGYNKKWGKWLKSGEVVY